MLEVDVLVVGYGPVGAALAGLLGRYGAQTLVVDKAFGIFTAPRAIALDDEALRILQTVGLDGDAFAKVVIPCVKMRSSRFGQLAQIDTAGTVGEHPKLVTFFQPELERALRDHAERQRSVTVRTGAEVIACVDEGDHVRVTTRSDGGERVVRARYVVGADGASSRVRALVGLELEGDSFEEEWLIVDAAGVPNNIDHVEFLCDPDRPTPHMVAPGGRARWEFMLKPGETPEQMEADATIERLLAPWTKGQAVRLERRAVYRFHARACRAFSKGRVFLAGDAAHVSPPFVGQGLVSGLRDAVNLAWKLAWVVHGRARPAVLGSYDRERRPHAVKMINLAKLMGKLVAPRSHASALAMHGALALVSRLPFASRLVSEWKPAPAYEEGLFVRGGQLRGAWFPQALVRRSGALVRSDDALGAALVLVGLGVDPRARVTGATLARWSRAGGDVVDLGEELVSRAAPRGSCVVVRPDRTVLHDGPIEEVERVVSESLDLLGA